MEILIIVLRRKESVSLSSEHGTKHSHSFRVPRPLLKESTSREVHYTLKHKTTMLSAT
jgi:hypothetical protein